MTKSTRSRRTSNREDTASFLSEPELRLEKTKRQDFKALNKSQQVYLNKINASQLTFGIGPAGTGKTMCAAAAAAKALENGDVKRIIVTRPMVEAGEEMGFLPGDMNEKFSPYVAPLMECLSKMLGKTKVEYMLSHEKIVFLPLAYSRGWTFEDSFVILDEAQNTTKSQMKLFLTRIGKHSKIVVDGDISQKDIKADGLDDAIRRLAGVGDVAVHRFTTDDIVRAGIVRDIIKAYSDDFDPSDEDVEGLNRYLDK